MSDLKKLGLCHRYEGQTMCCGRIFGLSFLTKFFLDTAIDEREMCDSMIDLDGGDMIFIKGCQQMRIVGTISGHYIEIKPIFH